MIIEVIYQNLSTFLSIVVILIPFRTSIFLCPHWTAWIREVLTDGDSLLPGSVALTLRSDASEVQNLWGIFFFPSKGKGSTVIYSWLTIDVLYTIDLFLSYTYMYTL